jgi:serine/threonine protein kinase
MPPDRDPTPAPGARQRCLGGRFVLLDGIAAGGGATVLRARDLQLPRQVAIKLLRSRDEDLRRRFVQEAEVLANLDHPGIVRALAHGADGDDLYTALERIDGPDLCEHLAGGPMPWRQALEVGVQVAAALDAVHRLGLVHRDVKPANLMLARRDPLQVKLIDFGVVRITDNYRVPTGATARRPTDVGKAPGTPGYQPLEAGLVEPNPGFDVFALAVTLHQLLTGRLPEEPLRPLRDACDAPDDLERVLAAALAPSPEDRTRSAAELGRALAAVLAAHPARGAASPRIDGRYELIGLVGTGAKADVYRAVHRGTGRDVALKFLRSSDPDDRLRFAREAKLLDAFADPALPRFYDYAPAAGPPYIAMALAAGVPAARLCTPPRLRPVEVAAVGAELARVLAVVHARGVVHRDVNASNVLIADDGRVTLIDFGSAELGAKFWDVPAGERRYLTPPEARVAIPDGGIGQLAWSAPETRGDAAWTDRSDIYSLGHLLFRLLTGKVPRKGADPPSDPQEFASACPDDLAAAISAALHADPRDRPSAAQLAELLQDVVETEDEAHARALHAAVPVRPTLRLLPTQPTSDAPPPPSRVAPSPPHAPATPLPIASQLSPSDLSATSLPSPPDPLTSQLAPSAAPAPSHPDPIASQLAESVPAFVAPAAAPSHPDPITSQLAASDPAATSLPSPLSSQLAASSSAATPAHPDPISSKLVTSHPDPSTSQLAPATSRTSHPSLDASPPLAILGPAAALAASSSQLAPATSQPATRTVHPRRPPPTAPTPVVRSVTRRRLGVAALGLSVLALAWWLGDRTPDAPPRSAVLTAASREPPPPPVVPDLRPAPRLASTDATLPPMLDVLDTAAAALQSCSALAGGLLVVEYTTDPQSEMFAAVAIRGRTSPAVDRCVREATVPLRFRPERAQIFTKEYSP